MRLRFDRALIVWGLLAALVLAQIAYPLVLDSSDRARLVVVTVVLGYCGSVVHALVSRGVRAAAALVAVTTTGGFLVEALGVSTGFPFGDYIYYDGLGWKLFGVPAVIPLAWTWMAWPAWLAAGRLTSSLAVRIPLAGYALAAWDLFLDPQMTVEGYWVWEHPHPALPGVPTIPISNYLGWLAVGIFLMGLLALSRAARAPVPATGDRPMHALYLWTWASCVLAHAVFLDLPASAAWGGLAMGLVAVPLAVRWKR